MLVRGFAQYNQTPLSLARQSGNDQAAKMLVDARNARTTMDV